MISGVDHVAIIVRDLEKSLADFSLLLGRSPSWRGTLEGASHAWFQLPNTAIDVISPAKDGHFGGRAKDRLADKGEGIWSIGLRVSDLIESRRLFERRGLAVSEPIELESFAEGGEKRAWRYANIARESTAGIPLFLVEAQRTPWPLSPHEGHASAAVSGLDHIVIRTRNADRAAALFGARFGLDLRLDRSSREWGSRLLFFRCGDLIMEVGATLGIQVSDEDDSLGGLALRIPDVSLAHQRLKGAGFDISELRKGRKPGTRVFTVRDRTANVPILLIESVSQSSS